MTGDPVRIKPLLECKKCLICFHYYRTWRWGWMNILLIVCLQLSDRRCVEVEGMVMGSKEIDSCDSVMLRALWPTFTQHITAGSRRAAEVVSLAALSLLLTDWQLRQLITLHLPCVFTLSSDSCSASRAVLNKNLLKLFWMYVSY